ncbi:T-complex protein 1 subunit gamma [Neurospora crassa]|nr:T-complex protein 1 subunit gamma [Neurospora crassa]
MQAPVLVMNTNSGERQTGRKAQMSNIAAAKTVADIIRSCLGPKAMLKMLLDPMGGIVLTNDGHAILREIEVSHPAAKSMIELSRTQDEEVGDGTTTVIILAGEILAQSLPQLERNIHPVVIISAFKRALKDALQIIEDISLPIDINDDQAMYKLISSSIGTKYVSRWSELMCGLALKAVRTVTWEQGNGKKEVDIKRYARVEKVPGGEIEDSRVLDGVMLNKDITHPKMRRRIENPRIILLDCPLEYKKGESQTNIEITKEEDWNRILQIEEEQVKQMCEHILAFNPDLVITEKGVSGELDSINDLEARITSVAGKLTMILLTDLAQHYLMKANVTALRRVRKTDNNRIARATGATIVNRVEDLQESDVGTNCGLFEVEKIGDEYFTFLTKCKDPKACTVLLRGPSKDVLNEIERNLQDAMGVARNVMFHPRLSPGGGATEMAVSVKLTQLAKSIEGVQQWPYKAVAEALEVIPRTLVQNAGKSPVRVLTDLRAKHAEGKNSWGINGDTGAIVDMKDYGVWEPEAIKVQSMKTAVEAACLLLRVDDICSARKAQPGVGVSSGGGDE